MRERVGSVVVTVLAVALVWVALVAPDRPTALTAGSLVRVPVEGVCLLILLLLLPCRARRWTAVAAGLVLALLTVVRLLDLALYTAVGRPFDLLADWGYVGSAVGLVKDAGGTLGAAGVVLGVLLVTGGLLVLLPLAVLRLTRLVHAHRPLWRGVAAALAATVLVAVVSEAADPSAPRVVSSGAADVAVEQVRLARDGLRDRALFARQVATDSYRNTPADDLLTGLRGRDVLVVFVESYGRVALEGPATVTAPVATALADAQATLDASGWSSRSAFLTSPTFGGLSWLAHSTLQAGVWVDSQRRYDALVAGDRFTLSDAFGRAGWRTVSVVPSDHQPWSVGRRFYHYDALYDATNLGYAGPSFGYATMPDQYTLAALTRRELAPAPHSPVMAEVDLVSSHAPWAPLPRMVGWDQVGDGSVFDGMPAQGRQPGSVWPNPARVQAAYGRSIAYTLDALVAFVAHVHDDNLVLVVLGDHQPAGIVSGPDSGHDAPVAVVARDPQVIDRISGWGWQAGLRPGPTATVWPMDAFRDRFLAAYR